MEAELSKFNFLSHFPLISHTRDSLRSKRCSISHNDDVLQPTGYFTGTSPAAAWYAAVTWCAAADRENLEQERSPLDFHALNEQKWEESQLCFGFLCLCLPSLAPGSRALLPGRTRLPTAEQKPDQTPKVLLQGIVFGVSHQRREAALNHSWRRAAQISWSLLFSEGSCPFLDVCAVMSPSRFLSGRSFWLHGSNFEPRHYQEVGNVNQSFAFSRAFWRMSVLEEAKEKAFVAPNL